VIDWLTVRVDLNLKVQAGHVMSVTADGEIEWISEKRQVIEGSHSAAVTLKSFPTLWPSLEISGNPAKFMQGHNLFGSVDLQPVAVRFVMAVMEKAGYELTAAEITALCRGVILITRIDVNRNSDFGTRPRALAAVRALSECSHLQHRGRGSLIAEGTCIWGKGSRRWNMKAYAKGQELKAHPLPEGLQSVTELQAYSEGVVRREVTIRAMELKRRGLEFVQGWDKLGVTPLSLFDELAGKLNIAEATMQEPTELEKIPVKLRGVFAAWEAGHDVRQMYPTRTFYRYRKALLSVGIDIAVQKPRERSNVVRLVTVLEGREVGVPDWARGTPLYFDPLVFAA